MGIDRSEVEATASRGPKDLGPLEPVLHQHREVVAGNEAKRDERAGEPVDTVFVHPVGDRGR
jgi:hypothetical protein